MLVCFGGGVKGKPQVESKPPWGRGLGEEKNIDPSSGCGRPLFWNIGTQKATIDSVQEPAHGS